jgi:hypothetical protein
MRPAATVLRLPLALLAGCGVARPYTAAELVARAAELRDEAPAGFTVVLAPPFVVVGDGPPELVREDAQHTVVWAASLLRRDFFARDPEGSITVWLFDGEESYLRNANILFGDYPPSPYGYYSSWHDALIVNAASGRGTLVHEMVHPFIAADFPGCPPWIDEGLASLFEAPEERAGQLRGRVNWRLPRLRGAIRRGELPTFDELLHMGRGDFYDDDHAGRNYAQARYLLYYLQEAGMLRSFYRRARAARDADPSGSATLLAVSGEPSLQALQARWQTFVLALPSPDGPPG